MTYATVRGAGHLVSYRHAVFIRDSRTYTCWARFQSKRMLYTGIDSQVVCQAELSSLIAQ